MLKTLGFLVIWIMVLAHFNTGIIKFKKINSRPLLTVNLYILLVTCRAGCLGMSKTHVRGERSI